MPLVEISRDPKVVPDDLVQLLGHALRVMVAAALDTPEEEGGCLSPNEVGVRVRDQHPLDVNALPLEIHVVANYYPARHANVDQRRAEIVENVQELLPEGLVGSDQAFVWVLLVHASFEMI